MTVGKSGICQHHDHANDSRISLMLVIPPEQARPLLARIDEIKGTGEVASIDINAMHIVGVMADETVTPDAGHWISLRHRAERPGWWTWWPIPMATVAIYGLVGWALASAVPMPIRAVLMAGVWAAVGYRITGRVGGFRWRLRPKQDEAGQ